MEARQSRASSRYASAAAFNGPVRRWKKQWVTDALCRWTPLSAADHPPTRRFRYTPIVPIEKGVNNVMENESSNNGNGNGATTLHFSKEQDQEMNKDEDEDKSGFEEEE